jgi:putative tricarboxylic transport membrane protein
VRKVNIYSSLFLTFAAVAICISAYRLSLYGQRGPGPGFMGFWTGILLFVLSLHLFLKNLLFSKGEEGKGTALVNWKLNVLIIGMLIFYAVILERLGFLLGVFTLISVLFAASKTMKWYIIVGSALLIAVASHILFSVLLRIGLPLGVLSFLR